MEEINKKYLNSTCTPSEFEQMVNRLSSEESASEMDQDLKELWDEQISQEESQKPNEIVLVRVQKQILEEELRLARRRIGMYTKTLAVAASIVVLIGISSLFLLMSRNGSVPNAAIVTQTIQTPPGARTQVFLPDGSHVWINSASRITFPSQFGKVRHVELVGQAYFEVQKNHTPFEVVTPKGTIAVTGTTFDVKAYDEEEALQTTLVEGSVKLINNQNQFVELKPSQQASLGKSGLFSISSVDPYLYTSWKDGRLIFKNVPFQNVAKELERWYNVQIQLLGNKLSALRYTGTIEMETFPEVLELINATTPIKYTFNKNTRVLKISSRETNSNNRKESSTDLSTK